MDYLTFLETELKKAAEIAERYFDKAKTSVKPDRSILTEADLAIGKQLVAAVREAWPDHNIIDEEAGVIDRGSRYTWVIDPIEATSNFAAGLPQYGIMVGLLEGATPVAGGIIAPAYNKLYLAEKGKGATCNGKPIHVNAEAGLDEFLVSFSTVARPENVEAAYRDHRLMAEVALASRGTRDNNCEAVDTMYVAEGRYGGRVNLVSKIWDNIAPQIICEEAGAIWTAVDGSPNDYSNPLTRVEQNYTFCVAGPVAHRQLQTIIRKHEGTVG